MRIPSLTCCCKRFRSFVLNTLHYITLHSGWQVRSFVDASRQRRVYAERSRSISDHSFPRIKQSLVPRLSFQKCFTSQPSFRSIRYALFDPHSLNPFRNPTASYSAYSTYMQVRLLPHCRTVASRTLAHAQFYATASRKSTVLPRHGLHPHSSSIVTISC